MFKKQEYRSVLGLKLCAMERKPFHMKIIVIGIMHVSHRMKLM